MSEREKRWEIHLHLGKKQMRNKIKKQCDLSFKRDKYVTNI